MKTESLLYILFNTDTVRNYFGESVNTETGGRSESEEDRCGENVLRRDTADAGGAGDEFAGEYDTELVDGSESGGIVEPEGAF